MKNRIEINDLSFRYSQESPLVFTDLSMEAKAGQIIGITGLSGCGKSTLGCCVAGVIPKMIKGEMKGSVKVDGTVGMIFQDPDSQIFLPTVEDELAFGPENLCIPKEEIEQRITAMLDLVGMASHRKDNPERLSGGEKQLIVFAAVLCMDPDIIVCDEVLTALDEEGKSRILDLLKKLRFEGKTILLIEHDEDILSISDECWLLVDGTLKPLGGFQVNNSITIGQEV